MRSRDDRPHATRDTLATCDRLRLPSVTQSDPDRTGPITGIRAPGAAALASAIGDDHHFAEGSGQALVSLNLSYQRWDTKRGGRG